MPLDDVIDILIASAPSLPFSPGFPSVPFVPLVPALATANENFLFTVTSSMLIEILASHATETVAVVVNVIVTFWVPLPISVALIPVGHLISLLVILID